MGHPPSQVRSGGAVSDEQPQHCLARRAGSVYVCALNHGHEGRHSAGLQVDMFGVTRPFEWSDDQCARPRYYARPYLMGVRW